MSADLDDIQRAVEALPWVEHARVAAPLAEQPARHGRSSRPRRRAGATSGLLNTRGELFVRAATHVPAELPRLSGPDGTRSRRWRSATWRLQGRMLEAGMRIAALRLDERGAWEMDLDSGVTVRLGRRDVDERFERFIRTASQVIAHRADRDHLRRHALLQRLRHRLAQSRHARRGAGKRRDDADA